MLLGFVLPLLVIPILANKADNWYYLIAIGCYYIGMLLVAYRQQFLLMIPFFFCLWFWYAYGFNIHDFVFFLFAWLCLGSAYYFGVKELERYVNRTLPENEQNAEYNGKLEKMEKLLDQYRLQHPGEKITQEVIENIRTKVFFEG